VAVASAAIATTGIGVAASSTIKASARPRAGATCYSPQQIRVAYGIAPLIRRGTDGRGETVVLPALADGLPGACSREFTFRNQVRPAALR